MLFISSEKSRNFRVFAWKNGGCTVIFMKIFKSLLRSPEIRKFSLCAGVFFCYTIIM